MTPQLSTRRPRVAWSSGQGIDFQILELETLYQEAPIALCFVDTEMRFLRINERLSEINGKSVEEHIGATINEMIPEIADQIVPHYQRIIETGRTVRDVEVRGVLPSDPGAEHVWLAHHHPVKSSNDDVVGIMTVLQDITEIKKTQAELERVKEHLSRAQQVSGVGSWEWDIVEDRVWWSQNLFPILHQDPERYEPSLNGFFDVVHPDDRPMIRKQLTATLEEGAPYAISFRLELFDGSTRTIEAHAVVERSQDGTPVRLIGTARDATPPKRPGRPRRR